MFGFLDESGAPGKAMNKNDYLLLSLVIFDSEEYLWYVERLVANLREKLKLPENYEFHCSRNSTHVQREFVKLLSEIDFSFIVIAIKKDNCARTASFDKIAKLLIREICARFDSLKIEMDSNLTLYHGLRKIIRERSLKSIKLRQNKSHSSAYLQIADYIANISSRKIKGSDRFTKWFDGISRKAITLIVVDRNKK